jgi:hypothetical protein
MTGIVEFGPTLPTLELTQAQRYTRKLRLEVFTRLCHGEKPHCQCPGCEVDYIEFLTCDHIDGNGAAHRKEHGLGTGAAALWRWIKNNGYPEGQFQVLCQNCNHAKGHTRTACPMAGKSHTREA